MTLGFGNCRRDVLATAIAAFAVFAAFALPATAGASFGEIVQKPGGAGCLQHDTHFGTGCTTVGGLDGADAVAVSPDGNTVYVVATGGLGIVRIFDRAADGSLTVKAGCAGYVTAEAGACPPNAAVAGARWVTVSPDGSSVYVAGSNVGKIAIFDRAGDGTLTADGSVDVPEAKSVVVSPDGNSVYAVGTTAMRLGFVSTFDRAAGGGLTFSGCISDRGAGCVDGKALWGAREVTVSPDGASVYVADTDGNGVAVFDRAAGGALTQNAGTAGCVTDDGSDGVDPGVCADGRALSGSSGVSVSPDGKSVYVAAGEGGLLASDALAVFDRAADGSLTQKPGPAGCIRDGSTADNCTSAIVLNDPWSVAVSPDGRSVYTSSASPPSGGLAVFDRAADGSLTQKPQPAGCVSNDGTFGMCGDGLELDFVKDVTVSPDGSSVYAAAAASDVVGVFDRDRRPQLAVADVSVAEGNSGQVNATLTVTATPAALNDATFNFATADGSATQPADYTAASGPGTITAGQSQTTIQVPVTGDTIDEPDETFTVTLSNPTGATFADATATVTITDDDAPAGGGNGGGGGASPPPAGATGQRAAALKKCKKKSKKARKKCKKKALKLPV